MAREDRQRAPLAGARDEDRDRPGAAQQRQALAGAVEPVAASGGDVTVSPASRSRIAASDSSSQSSRSPKPEPKSKPKVSCSSSRYAAPRPSTKRPLLMWSTVTAAFATSAGWRKVFAETGRPTEARWVIAAQAETVLHASKTGCPPPAPMPSR